mgnify:CR=1 FL=1
MPASKRVGVSDIAKHAGVSIGTVSNYLNYPERVSDTLKEKIGAKNWATPPAETRFSPSERTPDRASSAIS